MGNGAAGDSQAPKSGVGLPGTEFLGRERLAGERLAGERLAGERLAGEPAHVAWPVDCAAEETFLYAATHDVSDLGIFVVTREPLDVGTRLTLRFEPGGAEASFGVSGVVQWINAVRPLSENRNPGMGVLFVGLEPQDRRRLKATIRTFAYVRNFVN